MMLFTALFPGYGLLHRLNNEYFCAQNIINKPVIANTTIIGCNEAKKQVNRNKLTI